MNYLENLTQLLSIFICTLIITAVIRKIIANKKTPPGPYGLPIIGYIPPSSTKKLYEIFVDLEKKYGKVIYLPILMTKSVIINDAVIAKKVLSHPEAMARPTSFTNMDPGGGGFLGKNGKEWAEQRRFCVTVMKSLGLGRGEWETMIHDEALEMIKELKISKGKPLAFTDLFEFSQTNNLLSLLIGKRLFTDRHSQEAQTVMACSEMISQFTAPTCLASNIPEFFTRFLAKFEIAELHKLVNSVDSFEAIIRREIKKHIQTRQPNQKPNFIDYYLEELRKETKDGRTFSEESLFGNIAILYLAAIDTTKASIHWLILLTAKYPEVQKRIHQEIDQFAGKDRLIHWEERNNLSYTMATINEMLRWVATVPLFPPRQATADIPVDGHDFVIPKDTMIIVNNWRVLRGPGNPDDFKPERFLKSTNDKKMDNFFPFSTGRRNCPGEQVAMMTIFLYYTCIMQNFTIASPEGKSIVLKDTGSEIVRHPVPQELRFIER